MPKNAEKPVSRRRFRWLYLRHVWTAPSRQELFGGSAGGSGAVTYVWTVCLLKTVNYRESSRIFPCDRRTVGRYNHHSIRSRFRALVAVSQPSVAGTRACRPATSAGRLAAATRSAPPALFRRPAPMGVALPSVAAGPRWLGNRQTGDGGEMASQGLSDLLAVALALSRTPQDERRNPGPHPWMSRANPLWGAPRVHVNGSSSASR
jgi:hypothetical protein